MTLPELAITRRVTIVMIIFGIVLLGLIAVNRLTRELYPRVTFPQLTIVTNYANAAPEEIETLITKPIEEAVGSVSGLRSISSVSREGKSIVTCAFNWGVNVDFAALGLREKIDLVKEKLPKESEDPVVLKFDPLARPILILSMTGANSLADLKHIAEKTVKDNLEKVTGIASATISGGLDREILVEVDQGRLQASKISILSLVDSLEKSNLTYPAGSIKKGLYEYLIRTMGEFKTVADVEFSVAGIDRRLMLEEKLKQDIFVEREKFGPRDTLAGVREEAKKEKFKKRLILVRDISQVKDTFKERTSISRHSGQENISVSVQKQAGVNVIEAVDRVKAALETLKEELETRNVQLEIIYDQSRFIRAALRGVADAAVQGGVLAFAVLYIFLRSLMMSFIVTIAIPVTILGVFFLMYTQGISMNTMSLGGLALGVGMLIDNGIVVTENIFRFRKEAGLDPRDAVIKASNEVIWALFASTLTTCAVFFPLLLFVPGVAGQLFRDLSWTVIFSQILSWGVSLSFTPLLALYIPLKAPGERKERISKQNNLYETLERYLKRLNPKQQNWLLFRVASITILVFVVGLLILSGQEREVLPKVDQGQFILKIEMPAGTKLETTEEVVTQIEKVALQFAEVENTAVSVGSATTEEGAAEVEALKASQGQILVNLKKKRRRSSAAVLEDLRIRIETLPLKGGRVEYLLQESEFQFAATQGKPIAIEIKGFDYKILEDYLKKVEAILKGTPGVFDIQNDLAERSPETKLEIDRRKAALYGITALDISLTAKAAIDGVVATWFKEAGREFDIRVRLREEDRKDLGKIEDLLIHSPVFDTEIPLKEVAKIVPGTGPSEIWRRDQERTIVASADIQRDINRTKVLKIVQERLQTLGSLPEGYNIALTGEATEVRETFLKIIFALVLAIILVYMIMASQFESLLQPLVIMFTVPLSIIGVAIALWMTRTTLNSISLLGVILLGGIVVNNGIVLVEYLNQRRAMGEDLITAAIRTSQIRAKAILMTAITTAAGALPLALGIGEGTEIQAPMAITVIGGIITATLFTLFVVPSVYVLLERLKELVKFRVPGFRLGREL